MVCFWQRDDVALSFSLEAHIDENLLQLLPSTVACHLILQHDNHPVMALNQAKFQTDLSEKPGCKPKLFHKTSLGSCLTSMSSSFAVAWTIQTRYCWPYRPELILAAITKPGDSCSSFKPANATTLLLRYRSLDPNLPNVLLGLTKRWDRPVDAAEASIIDDKKPIVQSLCGQISLSLMTGTRPSHFARFVTEARWPLSRLIIRQFLVTLCSEAESNDLASSSAELDNVSSELFLHHIL